MPWIIYTWFEIVLLGNTERELKDTGETYKTGIFPIFSSSSAEDIAHSIHTRPNLAKAIHKAALASDNRALHI